MSWKSILSGIFTAAVLGGLLVGPVLPAFANPVEDKPAADAASASPAAENGTSETNGTQNSGMDDEVLALIEAAQQSRAKGDHENALDLLDDAYALVLEANGDPEVARQKDDLRFLISRNIVTTYSAMQMVTPGRRSEIPLISNADVEKEIRSFQTYERNFFIDSYRRSFLYRPMIVRELKKAGLPEELSWLPLVESGFKIAALSRARALGLWQFIPSTGYKYGMDRDEWIDERMDPEKSTRGAIAYLRDLHGMFGDWMTVLASYNCGEGRVMRVISAQRVNYMDRFWDLYHQLPYETARYVPRFLATVMIIKDPKKYGFDLPASGPKSPLLNYEEVKARKTMRLEDIATKLKVPEESVYILNAELRHRITPDRVYSLKLPAGSAVQFAAVQEEIPRYDKPLPVSRGRASLVSHRVKKGETLASIAKRYGTSVKNLRKVNRSVARKGIRVGMTLKVPLYGAGSSRLAKKSGGDVTTGIRYKVKKGDTLASIAKRHHTTVTDLRQLNGMKSNAKVKVGQVIRIEKEAAAESTERKTKASGKGKKTVRKKAADHKGDKKEYVVKKGDSLYTIAKRNALSVDRLRELNGLSDKSTIKAGQVLQLD